MCVPKKKTILPLTNTMSDGWTCEKCVGKKNVWCEADPFFGGKSSCVSTIDSSNGFYGDCSDITFGADNLESSLDCTFKSSNGELFLALIIGSVVLVVFLGACRMVRGQWCQVGSGLSRSQRVAQRALHSVQMNQNPHQHGQVLGIGQQQDLSVLQQPVPMYRQQPIQITGGNNTDDVRRVLFDYVASASDELTISAGTRVTVLNKMDDGWCMVRICSSPSSDGLLPENFLSPATSATTTQQQPVPMYQQQPIQIVQPVPIQPMQPVQPIVPVPVQPMYLQQQQQQQPVIAQAVPIYQKNNKN